MISDAAVKRLARQQRVDPVVVDRDHALGVVLWALSTVAPGRDWIFKGGTCLRKCYYADYRFSEDLDFTVAGPLRISEVEGVIGGVAAATVSLGVELLVDQGRTEVMHDEYGRESVEIKVPYRSALRMGSYPNIQFHLSADETMAFAPDSRRLMHPYEDAPRVDAALSCYVLEEVLAEKLRAVSGQRRHAIARDIYDIAQLIDRQDVNIEASLEAVPGKARLKGLDTRGARRRFVDREPEYRANWNQQLAYLVTDGAGFDRAFATVVGLLERLEA